MPGIEDNQPSYVISVAARMVGVHVQTLRYYERLGIIEPARSRGNTRLYSARDIETLRRIKSLLNELGVNLAGVEVIMRMSDRMAEMEQELRRLRTQLQQYRQVERRSTASADLRREPATSSVEAPSVASAHQRPSPEAQAAAKKRRVIHQPR